MVSDPQTRNPSASGRKLLSSAVQAAALALALPVLAVAFLFGSVSSRLRRAQGSSPRLVWVGNPALAQALTSRALRYAGYESIAVAFRDSGNAVALHYDSVLALEGRRLPGFRALQQQLRYYLAFAKALASYDVLHSYFDGGYLKLTPLRDHEFAVWKWAGKRLVLMPYGSDAFDYDNLPDLPIYTRLKEVYPRTREERAAIRTDIMRGIRHADCVVGAVCHTVNLPRVDVWPVLWYPYPEPQDVKPAKPGAPHRIAHATNHPRLKGTEALKRAVAKLRSEGIKVDLDVISGVPHADVMARIQQADIFVDQLLFGYAMAAIEAASLGKVVVTNLDFPHGQAVFREHSYLDACPFLSADEQTIENVLRSALSQPEALATLGGRCRDYVESHHSPRAVVELFGSVYDAIWYGKATRLSGLYTPQAASSGAGTGSGGLEPSATQAL